METGTGKTYVLPAHHFRVEPPLRIHQFVVVVPSVAIKEGVYKTLQITEEHFRSSTPTRPSNSSLRFQQARPGAQLRHQPEHSDHGVTVGAINKKDVNNLYKDTEKDRRRKAYDLIKATRPILIVDEPQSVDGPLEAGGARQPSEP